MLNIGDIKVNYFLDYRCRSFLKIMFGVLLLPVDGSICKPSAETNFEEGT
jgi:hypothetical protein